MKGRIKEGEALFAEGKIGEAKKVFYDLLKENPESPESLNNLGVIFFSEKKVSEAEDYFLKAIAIKENYFEALLNLSNLRQMGRRWEEASALLEKCNALDNQDPQLLTQLGMAYLKMGANEKAIPVLMKSLQLDPNQKNVIELVKSVESSKVQSKSSIIDTVQATDRYIQHPCQDKKESSPSIIEKANSLTTQKQISSPAQVILVWPAEMTLPSVSLLTIATELKHAGYTAKVIYPGEEERSNPDALERFLRRHVSSSTLWVGFSVMTVFIAMALDMCRIVRSINPDIKTVWGGYHPMLFPEQTAEHPLVDFAVVGDGEYTAIELTERLLVHRPVDEVKGLVFKTKTGIVRAPRREYTDLRELHPTDYSLLEGIEYFAHKPNGRPWGGNVGTLHSGSGCPYRCAFCINSALKRPWTGKTAEQITEDAASLLRLGFKNIEFEDELFFAEKKRAFEFIKLCDQRGLKFGWEAQTSVHTIKKYTDEELLYFKKHGLKAMAVGAESGSEAQLKRLNKAITPQETLAAAERIEKLGILCQFATIIGTPNESRSDMAATLRMLNGIKSRSPRYSFYLIPQIYRPYPGCELYNQAIQLGYRPPETLENWANLLKTRKQYFTDINDLPWLDSGTKNLINDVLMCVTFYLQRNSYTAPKPEDVAILPNRTQIPVGKIFYDIVEERFNGNPRYDLIEQLSQNIAAAVKNVVSELLKQHQVRFN